MLQQPFYDFFLESIWAKIYSSIYFFTYILLLVCLYMLLSKICHFSNCLLQSGQQEMILSHWSTQPTWNRCEHGSSLTSSLSWYFAKHMQHSCIFIIKNINTWSVQTNPTAEIGNLYISFMNSKQWSLTEPSLLSSMNFFLGSCEIWSSVAPRSMDPRFMLYPSKLLISGTQQQSSKNSRNGKE